MTSKALLAAWAPLHALHHAKRPVLVVGAGVSGWERLAELLCVPAIQTLECDWLLAINSDQALKDTIAGVEAVLSHDGSFPDFRAWRDGFGKEGLTIKFAQFQKEA